MTAVLNAGRRPPFKTAGAVFLAIIAGVLALVYFQFRGDFTPATQLTLLAPRAGLVMDTGAKVTYNGVPIGRVTGIEEVSVDGVPKARITLDVAPRYISIIPANVTVAIEATTVFGNKYVSFTSPETSVPQRVSPHVVIDVGSVTTEFNTVFETVVSIAEQVDPVRLNATLTAAAQAFDGLGDRFGVSLVNGDQILGDLNPQLPQLREDTQRLADLADVYSAASPDLWDGLSHAVTTARTLTAERANLDAALLASIGIANTGADIFERGGPYLVRGAQDLVPTSSLLNEYSPEIFCTIRNYAKVAPEIHRILGGDNGYALHSAGTLLGAGAPYIWPDNLPRVNAHGGPEGRPGCWQEITHNLWPAPYLVTDTGFSVAPYNHLGLTQPQFTDYLWGRQYGEPTINP
jgi:phospholipid/cholesterol/gamma-HCH transport system substrate-binding protein